MKRTVGSHLKKIVISAGRVGPGGIWLHISLLAYCCLIEVLLRTVSLGVTCRIIGVHLALEGAVGPMMVDPLPLIMRPHFLAVDRILSRTPFQDTCLRRSLLTCVALRRMSPVLRLGWVPQPPPGNAHAWVQIGRYSLESGLEGIVPLQVVR